MKECQPKSAEPLKALACGHHDSLLIRSVDSEHSFCELCEERSRRKDAETREAELERERDGYRARLDRAIAAAEEHFGESAVRYKLSLFKNGRAMVTFPDHMDGHWYALQRADNDAHVGLSLRVVEAEAERDTARTRVAELEATVAALREDGLRWHAMRSLILNSNTVGAFGLDYSRRWRGDSQLGWYWEKTEASIDAAIDAARKGGKD